MKIIYWIATGLLSALLLMSAGMYLFNYAEVSEIFIYLEFPIWIIYPLAIAKISAVAVLLIPKSLKIKEWAYSALFFEFLLACTAHVMIGDGEQIGAIIALVLLLVSYITYTKTFSNSK